MFNVYNALAAAACALILGVELDAIKKGLEAVVSVPGRVEMLPTQTPYRMILGLQPLAGRTGKHSENGARILPRAHYSGVRLGGDRAQR